MPKILIVEDEEKLARFVELELSHEGYEVDKAFDGRDGLEKLESGGYDLALLDISLPDMNGIALAKRIQELRPGTDIVFVTGHPQYAADSWSVHPKGYLLKPITKKDLQEELDYILSVRSSCRHA